MEYTPIDWGTYEGYPEVKRTSFIFRERYSKYIELIEEKHGIEPAYDLAKAIYRYGFYEEMPDYLHPEADGYFNLVKAQINRDITVGKKKRG